MKRARGESVVISAGDRIEARPAATGAVTAAVRLDTKARDQGIRARAPAVEGGRAVVVVLEAVEDGRAEAGPEPVSLAKAAEGPAAAATVQSAGSARNATTAAAGRRPGRQQMFGLLY